MYLTEPSYQHGTSAKTGVLLINLGTPEAPTKQALRVYLKEFLSDSRVVEIPRPIWWLILNAIILNTRPKKSAAKYAQIWTSDGSPLKVHTQRQTKLLEGYLRERIQSSYMVEYAMRYGKPSIADTLMRMKTQGCERILIVPLYPQYAASSTATAFDAVFKALPQMRNMPAIRTVKHYHDHPKYIAALAQSIREYWMLNGRPDKLIISFHGVPRYTLDKGDPYHCECQKTGRLLTQALGLNESQYQITFQSRFGRAKWLQPYTAPTLEQLGKQGIKRVDVVCPGFVSDCLETLEEIAMEGKASFLNAGGAEFHYIPSLNERTDWIAALSDITLENLTGWVNQPDVSAAEESRHRALQMGAKA